MDIRLAQDIDHFFSVFHSNTLYDLNRLLPPVPVVKQYQAELESEIDLLRTSILNRLEEEFRR